MYKWIIVQEKEFYYVLHEIYIYDNEVMNTKTRLCTPFYTYSIWYTAWGNHHHMPWRKITQPLSQPAANRTRSWSAKCNLCHQMSRSMIQMCLYTVGIIQDMKSYKIWHQVNERLPLTPSLSSWGDTEPWHRTCKHSTVTEAYITAQHRKVLHNLWIPIRLLISSSYAANTAPSSYYKHTTPDLTKALSLAL